MTILPTKMAPSNMLQSFAAPSRSIAPSTEARANQTSSTADSAKRQASGHLQDKDSNSFESLMTHHASKSRAKTLRDRETKEVAKQDEHSTSESPTESQTKPSDVQRPPAELATLNLQSTNSSDPSHAAPQLPRSEPGGVASGIASGIANGIANATGKPDPFVDGKESTRTDLGVGFATKELFASVPAGSIKAETDGFDLKSDDAKKLNSKTEEFAQLEHAQGDVNSPQGLAKDWDSHAQNTSLETSGSNSDKALTQTLNALPQISNEVSGNKGSSVLVPPQEVYRLVPEALDSAAFGQSFATQVSILTAEGIGHAELSLNPPNMGPVQIEIRHFEGGVEIDFKAANLLTRQAIQSSITQLREMLTDQGLVLQDSSVHSLGKAATPEVGEADRTSARESATQHFSNSSGGQQHPKHDGPYAYRSSPYQSNATSLEARALSDTTSSLDKKNQRSTPHVVSVFA